jgi:hypothetical protein
MRCSAARRRIRPPQPWIRDEEEERHRLDVVHGHPGAGEGRATVADGRVSRGGGRLTGRRRRACGEASGTGGGGRAALITGRARRWARRARRSSPDLKPG